MSQLLCVSGAISWGGICNNFTVKDKIQSNILGSGGYVISARTAQLRHFNRKAARNSNIGMAVWQ